MAETLVARDLSLGTGCGLSHFCTHMRIADAQREMRTRYVGGVLLVFAFTARATAQREYHGHGV